MYGDVAETDYNSELREVAFPKLFAQAA